MNQAVIFGRAAEFRRDIEVAVVEGVGQRLLQGDADANPIGLVANAEANGLLLQIADQWFEQRRVVLQTEDALGPQHALQQTGLTAVLDGRLEHLGDRLPEIARSSFLGT